MFSFVGDTVVDPFLGTGTTTAAALRCGRNSIGFEVDEKYAGAAYNRVMDARDMFSTAEVNWHG
jgi:DNA modification methylase